MNRLSAHTTSGFAALFLFCVLLSLLYVPACNEVATQSSERPAAPVSVATVVQKDVPVLLKAIGNVEPYNSVEVKSQVGGQLMRVHFVEGQDVQKGTPLFTVDPRPYETALKQAEANLAKDTAQMENARLEARRNEEMAAQGIISQQTYDQAETNFTALEAGVKADAALVENAKLQLKYCYINSPITGRAGDLIVDEGNIIKANADTPMVVINQIQPIYVTFSVPEQYLAQIEKYSSGRKIEVQAFTGEGEPPVAGELSFVDNAVDTATGTIKLKATFANKEKRLWPGQFVTISIILTTEPNAVVVPSQAVQAGQQGQYVFVVKNDLTVESRPVVLGRTIDSESVVQDGLKPGERVVTDGQLRLTSGSKIEIKTDSEIAGAPESQRE